MATHVPATRRSICHVRSCTNTVPPGMVVCGEDADSLVMDLLEVPGLALALESAHVKALRFSASTLAVVRVPVSSDDEESPIPFNPKASETAALLVDTLTRWGDAIAAEQGLFRPLNTAPVLARWLAQQVKWLRSAELGPEAVERIRAVIRLARGVVDRPADLMYAGPCDGSRLDDIGLLHVCGADLYAKSGQTEVTCSVCAKVFPLGERRRWLLGQAEDMLLPAAELARAIDGLGVEISPKLVRLWRDRGRLVAHGTTSGGRPLYRVGDVMDLVNAAALRTAGNGRHRADG